jgi:hypothetical protein
MDYMNQPVTAVLTGPLLRTPQGWVVLAFSVFYFFGALLFGTFDVEPPLAFRTQNLVGMCVAWPFLLFMYFVKEGAPSFVPSPTRAAWLAFLAAFPVLYFIWRI